MTKTAPLAIGGNRTTWDELPAEIRAEIERGVGSPVVAATSQRGGFSPGLASILTLGNGRKVFAKAATSSRDSHTSSAMRREIEVLLTLPEYVPAPRVRWIYDEGPWVVLVTESINGRNPVQPWRSDELRRFLDATTVLANVLSPSPIPALPFADDAAAFQRWRVLAADPSRSGRLDERVPRFIDRLAALEESWRDATAGTSLLHGDLRSDNLLLVDDGSRAHDFVAVDWSSVRTGAPWLDMLFSLPSVAMHGGGDPNEILAAHPLGRLADPDAVNVALAGAAGFFLDRSLNPVPPLMPTIREFQRAQGMIAIDWLAARMRWDG